MVNITSLDKSKNSRSGFLGASKEEERKKVRKVLGLIFGLTLLGIGLATLSREWANWWGWLAQPKTILSEKKEIRPLTATPTPKVWGIRPVVLEMIKPLKGKYGVYFEDLENKESFEINGKEVFTAASLIKLPVILALYRENEAGRINLDEVYRLQEKDKRSGAGSLQYKPAGFEISYRRLAELMGKQSDNTAFNVVAQRLGAENIQKLIDDLGMRGTVFATNKTTPEDVGLFFRKLFKEKIVYEKDKEEILSFLTETIFEDRIPAGVPAGVKVAHKVGTEVGVISDAGIVFDEKPFILVILSEDVNELEAKKILPEIAKKIYEMRQEGN